MKRILLLFALLLSFPAKADTVKSFTWNPITKLFNALTGQSGTKQVPDYTEGRVVNPACNSCGGLTSSFTVLSSKIGNSVTTCLWGTASRSPGSAGPINMQNAVASGFYSTKFEVWGSVMMASNSSWDIRPIRINQDGSVNIYHDSQLGDFPAGVAVQTNSNVAHVCLHYSLSN